MLPADIRCWANSASSTLALTLTVHWVNQALLLYVFFCL
jgi:hypothetical protein